MSNSIFGMRQGKNKSYLIFPRKGGNTEKS